VSQRQDDVLESGLRQLGLPDAGAGEQLRRYIDELTRWNTLGLVNDRGDDLISRHILDSLAPLGVLKALTGHCVSPRIADLGSGGGLPGIPLACFLPQSSFFLVERSGRKCGFLRNAVASMRLENVTVVEQDLDSVDAKFDLVVFRALSPLSGRLLARLLELVSGSGAICAYKGRASRIADELAGIDAEILSRLVIRKERIEVPFLDEERHLVVIAGL